ncbi:MAG: spermidine/putrescine ABC transporter substrate-binding protein [Lentisphaeria bacterium]
MIKKMLRVFLILFAIILISGCGKRKAVLHLFCWADYIDPEIITQFEKENNCQVIYDTFDSNEVMYAKLKAGASGYDIIFPSDYKIKLMIDSDMLLPIDKSKIPNLKYLNKKIITIMCDPEIQYAVPYMMSFIGLGYNKKKLPNFDPSWKIFENPKQRGRMTILDDYRQVLGAALLCDGLDPNTGKSEDLEKARETAMLWRENIAKFENEQYKNGLANDEFNVVMGYAGDLMQVIAENPEELAFAIPKEGTMLSCDMMVVPVNAPNKDLAYKFINFVHEPAIAARNIKFTCYHCPNTGAYPLLDKKLTQNNAIFIDDKSLAKSVFVKELSQETDAAQMQTWNKIKTGVR